MSVVQWYSLAFLFVQCLFAAAVIARTRPNTLREQLRDERGIRKQAERDIARITNELDVYQAPQDALSEIRLVVAPWRKSSGTRVG